MSVPAKKRVVCRELISKASLLIAVSLCALCCLSGCKNKTTVTPAATSVTKKPTAIRSEKIRDFQVRLEHLMEPVIYNYDSAGKPDPFQPFLRAAPKISRRTARKQSPKKKFRKPEICATPLECMEVGQLTLVAVVGNDKGKRKACGRIHPKLAKGPGHNACYIRSRSKKYIYPGIFWRRNQYWPINRIFT